MKLSGIVTSFTKCHHILAVVLSFGLVSCAGQQDQQQQGENMEVNKDNGDLGNDDAAEGNGQENHVNDAAGADEGAGGNNSAALNSDTTGDKAMDAGADAPPVDPA